jgi:hypothetical protein
VLKAATIAGVVAIVVIVVGAVGIFRGKGVAGEIGFGEHDRTLTFTWSVPWRASSTAAVKASPSFRADESRFAAKLAKVCHPSWLSRALLGDPTDVTITDTYSDGVQRTDKTTCGQPSGHGASSP